MKIGVFTVACPEYEPLEAIDTLSDIGYDGIEWRVTNDEGDRSNPSFWNGNRATFTAEELIEAADALKQRAAERNMAMPSIAAYIDSQDMDAVDLHMRAAAAVGAHCLRINSGRYDKDGPPFREQIAAARDRYIRVTERAKQYGLKALVEIHMGLLTPTVHKAMAVLDGLDPNHCGIMWDPGNQVHEGSEIYKMAVDIAGEYLAEVHVKNAWFVQNGNEGDTVLWKPTWSPLHKGIVHWPEVIAVLQHAGYEGWLMLEDFSTEQPQRERLAFDLKYLRGLIDA